jgi:hypothetical protein
MASLNTLKVQPHFLFADTPYIEAVLFALGCVFVVKPAVYWTVRMVRKLVAWVENVLIPALLVIVAVGFIGLFLIGYLGHD